MRFIKPLILLSTIATTSAVLGGEISLPTSLAAASQSMTMVCDRIPESTVPGVAAISNGCYGIAGVVNRRLGAVLGASGSGVALPSEGRPVLVRVAGLMMGIGARVRDVR